MDLVGVVEVTAQKGKRHLRATLLSGRVNVKWARLWFHFSITPEERAEIIKRSVVAGVYETVADRESADAKLKGR